MPGRILIIDDVATNRIVLKVRLTEARYDVLVAADGPAGLHLARTELPGLILLDGNLPAVGGKAVLQCLRDDPATSGVPVIVLLAADNPAARLAALRAGADDVMAKPVNEIRMMARLRALLRAFTTTEELRARDAALGPIGMTEAAGGFQSPGLVSLVAENPAGAMALRTALSALMPDRFVIQTQDAALGEAAEPSRHLPDVYVIASDLATKGDGLRLLSDLRSRSGTRHTAVCVVQQTGSDSQAAMAFDLGADDVVDADCDPRELALRLRKLAAAKRRDDALRETLDDGLRLAVIDPLTGLFNRRYALAQLGRIAARAQQGERSYAVLVIDIDRFKTVNDAFGHAAGDSVLVEVARRLTATLRQGDLIGRIGGEEFIVALPQTPLVHAMALARRLCAAVEQGPVRIDPETAVAVTVSIGLAICPQTTPPGDEPAEAVLARADQALLRSKAGGRNRVTMALSAA